MSEAPLSRTFSAEDRARMLRSLEEQSRRPNRAFRTHTVTLYRPQLDPVLKPEDFAFVPPDAT
jgi:hypothetical protein